MDPVKQGKTWLACDHAVKVNIGVNILEVESIDQVREQFTVILTVHCTYIDPILHSFRSSITFIEGGELQVQEDCQVIGYWRGSDDGKVKIIMPDGVLKELSPTQIFHIEPPDWENDDSLFQPRFSFGNALGEPELLQHDRFLEYCSDEGGHVFDKYKYQVTLTERLELQHMPFDRQLLTIKIYAEHPLWRMQFAPNFGDGAGRLNKHGASGLPTEWEVDGNVVNGNLKIPVQGSLVSAARVMVLKPEEDHFRSEVHVLVHIKRVPKFYLWNVFAVNCALTLGSAVSFACEPEDFNDRASIQFTILLTSVGYKLVSASWLPVKAYLTNMDIYILCNFLFQLIIILENFLVVLTLCRHIGQDDGNHLDGVYRGEYTNREPPTHECMPMLRNMEVVFAASMYGAWAFFHLAVMCIFWIGRTDRVFGNTWDSVYEENWVKQPEQILHEK